MYILYTQNILSNPTMNEKIAHTKEVPCDISD